MSQNYILEKLRKLPYVSSLSQNSLKQFNRYILSGLLAFITEYTTFNFLLILFSKFIANSLGMLVGFWISFLLNRYWSFQSKDKFLNQLYRYGFLFLINFLVSNFLIIVFSDYLSVNIRLSKILIMCMIVCWNFFLFKKIVYKK